MVEMVYVVARSVQFEVVVCVAREKMGRHDKSLLGHWMMGDPGVRQKSELRCIYSIYVYMFVLYSCIFILRPFSRHL